MGTPERAFALRVGQAIGKEFVDLTADDLEAIRFFTMEIPRVDQMNGPRPAGLPQEYPLESLMGRCAPASYRFVSISRNCLSVRCGYSYVETSPRRRASAQSSTT